MDYDRTLLPEVYRAARTLPAEALDVWGRAIRAMAPAIHPGGRVVDLGCGTARFTGLLADALNAPIVGIEPSLRMLGERDVHDPRLGPFVAGTAEAIPLATATIDLVFLSMVYHHLRSEPALAEMRRVLRPGGHVMVRTATRDSLGGYIYLAFFPEALAIDRARIPLREELIDACAAAGFTLRDRRIVRQQFAADHDDYYRKIALRGISSLQLISDESFARGLQDFAAYCRSAERAGPVDELVDLFLFSR